MTTVPSREPGWSRSRERRTRGVLAILAGVAAMVLLVAGMVLTVDGFPRQEQGIDAASGESPADPGPGHGEAGPSDRMSAGGVAGQPGADQAREESTTALEANRSALSGDPAVALEGLAALRAQAFVEADPDLLPGVDVAGSPAMSADLDAVGALAATGRILRDLSIDIRDPVALTDGEVAGVPALASLVAVTDPPPATEVSVVRATAALSSYTEAAAAAVPQQSERSPLMAAGQQELVFILWKSADGWRIHSVVEPPA